MSDEGEGDEGFNSEFSWTPVSPGSFGSNFGLYSALDSDLYSYSSLSSYDKASRSLEASISASAASATSKVAGSLTDYVGISGSAITPVGGAEIHLGFYSDSYGMVGGYFSLGSGIGLPSGSLGVVSGHSQSFSGASVSVSAGLSYGVVGTSKGYSFNPATGDKTGENWAFGLSVGPPVSASAAYSSTTSTEFTSLYLSYIQFLNWVGYPGNSIPGRSGY